MNNNTNHSFDLSHEAELLEKSAKKNDKYTVRRILDAHYSEFQMKPKRKISKKFFQNRPTNVNMPQSGIDRERLTNKANRNLTVTHSPTSSQATAFVQIPSIFINILHTAIESNALDVLRICLKYGLNANEPGTNRKTIALTSYKNNQQLIKYSFRCAYCLQRFELYNEHTQAKLIEALKTDENSETFDVINELKALNSDKDLYNSNVYLRCLPPIFLTISKCFHAATELLLAYGSCTNIQDLNGNTPLHIACAKSKTCTVCIGLLLKYHASSVVLNNIGHTPESIIESLKSPISIQDLRYKLIDDLFNNNLNGTSSTGTNSPAKQFFRETSNNSNNVNARTSIINNFSQNSFNTVGSTKSSIKNLFSRKHKSVSTFDVHSGMPLLCHDNQNKNENKKNPNLKSTISEVTNTLPKSKNKKKRGLNATSNPIINAINPVNRLLSVNVTTPSNNENNETLKKSLSFQSETLAKDDLNASAKNKNQILENAKHEEQVSTNDAASLFTADSINTRKSMNKSTFSSTNLQSIRSNDTFTKNDSISIVSRIVSFLKNYFCLI